MSKCLYPFIGILSQRWQILKKVIIGKPSNITSLIAATTVLHNYLLINHDKTYLPAGTADAIYGEGEGTRGQWRVQEDGLNQPLITNARNFTVAAAAARQLFVDYVNGPGRVTWQLDHVNRLPQRL